MKRVLAGCFLGGLLALVPAAQVVVEEIGTLQETYAQAEEAYNGYKFPRAIEALTPLLATLTRWEQSGRLQPQDETLLEKALELRGVCEYNIGQLDKAKEDFTRLIHLRPDYPFSRTRAQKNLRFFEETRRAITGTLELTIFPPDAQVSLDGRPLGAGGRSLPMLKGLHTVRVDHPGFESQEREVNAEVGATVPLVVRLIPNARTIFFFLSPEGTSLYIDDKPVGEAESKAADRPEWALFVRNNGGDPERTFAVKAPYIPPGKHNVRLVKQCFVEKRFLLPVTLDKENNLAGFIKPIALERHTVELRVTSRPSGAAVTVDGEDFGVTPLTRSGFCIGTHSFLVRKTGVGEYKSTLAVSTQTPFILDAVLRPTLLWVGLTSDQRLTDEQMGEVKRRIRAALGRSRLFNAAEAKEDNPLLADTFFAPGVGGEIVSSTTRDLCAKYETQGLLAGLLTASESGDLHVRLRLFVPDLPGADEISLDLPPGTEGDPILQALDTPPFLEDPARLFVMADVPGEAGPVLLRGTGDPRGPGPSDILLEVQGRPVPTASAARKALDGLRKAELRFARDGKELTWTFEAGRSPRVLRYEGPAAGYRRFWLLFRQALLSAETPAGRFLARLNLASADLNLGLPRRALEILEEASGDDGGTVGKTGLAYLRGVAFLWLGKPEEARPQLLLAASDPDATLDGTGDVLVQPLALDLLRGLPPPPATGDKDEKRK